MAEAGYTQVRKGDEIIKLDSALGLESAIATPRELDRPPVLSHPRGLQSTDSSTQNKRSGASVAQQVSLEILESQTGKETPKSLESPTASPRILERESTQAQKVDSSVESTPPKDTLESTPQKVDSSVAYIDTQGHTHQIQATSHSSG